MTDGLRIRNASGVTILDVTDRLTRLVYYTVVSAGVSGSVNLPVLNGRGSMQLAFSTVTTQGVTIPAIGHKVSRSGTTISWEPITANVQHPSEILVFVYN